MRYILGIANDETSSACLIRDKELIAAASEERFSRIKMDNSWPTQSIKYCLEFADIGIDELDALAYGWSAGFDAEKLMEQMQDPEVKAKLIANTEEAVERGVFGIPTFFVGDEMFFGKDKLWEVEELLND